MQIVTEKRNMGQELTRSTSLSQATNGYTGAIYFSPEEIAGRAYAATSPQQERHQAGDSGAFNCCLSCSVDAVQ